MLYESVCLQSVSVPEAKSALSINEATKTPAARKNILIRQERVDIIKLSKGMIITVAAITIPTIA